MTSLETESPRAGTNGAPTNVRLFTIPGSHPGTAAQLMLERKGIEYERTDLLPVFSWLVLRALRFPGVRVPALKIDGRRVQGSREIARELDRIEPRAALFPADPERRSAVEEVESFGDEDLQEAIRRILLWSLGKDTSPLASFAEGSRIGLPIGVAVRTAGPFVAIDARSVGTDDTSVRQALAALPAMLQRIDDWIDEGVLGGEEPNAADFQIATCLRLAMSFDDLRPAIEHRPGGELALRIVPDYPGRIPSVLPQTWLEPLRKSGAVIAAFDVA